jgi:hypothetical protein
MPLANSWQLIRIHIVKEQPEMIECISYSTHMQMIKSKCVKRLIQQHIITLIRPIVNARLQIKTKSDLQQIGGFL